MTTQSGNEISVTHITQTSAVGKVSSKQHFAKNGTSGEHVSSQADKLKRKADTGKLAQVVRDINRSKQLIQRELRFSVDKDSGKTVIKVMDMATKKVVRQIPTEETLKVAQMLRNGEEIKLFSSYS